MGRKSNAIQRREEIVRALFDCLSQSGHEKITVKQIAAQAGLPHGVIHYYFNKKDDIAAALVTYLTAAYNEIFEETIESIANPAEKLDRLIEYLVDAFVFDRMLNRVFYNLVQMGFERKGVNTPLRRMLVGYRGTIEVVLKESGAGEKSALLACLLVAIIEGLALQWMVDPDALKKNDVRHLVKETINSHIL